MIHLEWDGEKILRSALAGNRCNAWWNAHDQEQKAQDWRFLLSGTHLMFLLK